MLRPSFDVPLPTATVATMSETPHQCLIDLKESRLIRLLRTYIVGDSLVIRENLIATLEELAPIEVVGTAEDESTAVRWLTLPGNKFDLVIVDIFLKDGSGLGVLKASNALPQRHKLVVLSSYATSSIRRKCLEFDADIVFDQANDIDELIAYCNSLVVGGTANGEHIELA